jgi:hypothetical protein
MRYAFEHVLSFTAGQAFTVRLVTGEPGEAGQGQAGGRVFCMLNCRECDEQSGRPLAMPFGSPGERGKWATEHTRGTGHDRWLVRDERRPVVPGEVVTDRGELEAG